MQYTRKIFFTGDIPLGQTSLDAYRIVLNVQSLSTKTKATNVELLDLRFSQQIEAEIQAEKSGLPIILCKDGVLTIIADALRQQVPVKPEWRDWCHSYDRIYIFSKEKEFVSPSHYFYLQQAIMEECHLPYEVISGSETECIHAIESSVSQFLPQFQKERI